MKHTAIIVDIDGTLAIRGDRGPFEWSKVALDEPNIPVIKFVKISHGHHVIILVSGRDKSCKKMTEAWLEWNQIPYDELWMRPEGDIRKDCILKREIYEKEIEPNFDVIFVLDDRNQVVEMWRKELHLPCFQVAEGDF